MVSRPPLHLSVLDNEQSRPSFQRSNSTLSVPEVPPKDISSYKTSNNALLKKRPSTLDLPSPLTPIQSPIPSPVSQSDHNTSYVRSIARGSPPPLPRKSSSRPSTANSRNSRENITPWEFQSSPFETVLTSPIDDKFEKAPTPTLKPKTSSIKSKPSSIKSVHHQPSLRSRTSSTATGLVEEVTPWELYPPIPEKNTKYHMPKETIPEYSAPLNSPPPTTGTGFVEDVTPWELVPPPPLPPQENVLKSAWAQPHLASVDETSTLFSYDSASHHNRKLPSPVPPSVSGASQEHKVAKTGPMEDVTPWELEPGPTHTSKLEDGEEARVPPSARMRSSLTLAQLEEVTPWELHPAPPTFPLDDCRRESKDVKGIGRSTVKKKTSNSGSSFASNNSFVRGRKGDSKSSKTRYGNDSLVSTKQPARFQAQNVSLRSPDRTDDGDDEIPRHNHYRDPELPPTPHTATKPSTPSTGAPPSLNNSAPVATKLVRSEPSSKSRFNMSTADRKILTQLEFFKDAHDKEFVLKGKGYHQSGGGVTLGKVHHAFDETKAPYPRCYDHRAQDLDVWEIMICQQICNSWTWHVFEMPPKTVLDIGCGTGAWITHAAGTWRECQFWGLDLVPTQPDFTTLGDRDLKDRVYWVHHNFLEGLPFEAETFDYIHIKRVGLGVPEDKWDALFEECKRVLKQGGAFELIEEDLFFPGKPNDHSECPEHVLMMDQEEETKHPTTYDSSTFRDSTTSQPTSPSFTVEVSTSLSTHASPSDTPPTPKTNHTPIGPTTSPSETHTSLNESLKHVSFTHNQSSRERVSNSPPPPSTAIPSGSQSRSASKPILYVKTPPNPLNSTTFTGSAVSLLNAIGQHAPSPIDNASLVSRWRSPGGATSARDPPGVRSRTTSHETRSQASADGVPVHNGIQSPKEELTALQQDTTPENPRDHTILEAVYAEMLAARFINSTPISILQNYLEYHFTDVRTHPPLLFTFPPTALLHSESRYVTDSETESELSDEVSSDDGDACDAIRTKPQKSKRSKNARSAAADMPRSRYRCTLGRPAEDVPSDLRFLSFRHLIRHQSPYISFDGSRGYAFSPSTQAQRRSIDGKPSGPARVSRLPNKTLNIDLKTLNMHLYLRTMDILGCSEPMWEWVVHYQSKLAKMNNGTETNAPRSMSDLSLSSSASADSNDLVMHAIAEMTRDNFEVLLANFELDMQDQASVDYALQEQINWRVFASPRDHRRKAFDEACRKWDKWVARQEKRARDIARNHHLSKNGENRSGLQKPRHRQSNGEPLSATSPITQNGAVNGRSPGASRQQALSQQNLSQPIPIPFSPSSLPPHKRLSRAIRVFVAWKSRDPLSPNQAVHTSNGLNTTDTF